MKILHCCLANFYIDGYGYQKNILPKMHKLPGHEVMILASTETFINNKSLGYLQPSNYINENGIPVHRIPYIKYLPKRLIRKLRIYINTFNEIESFLPDIIFLHDIQFLDIISIKKYLLKYPQTKLFADGHADFSNSARNFISKYILHSIIYRYCAFVIIPFVQCFYGTLPARVDFFINMYKTPREKTKLLVMGADDELVKATKTNLSCDKIRQLFNIKDSDFLLVTGGKIDSSKIQTLNLMRAIQSISIKNIRMIIFGSIIPELEVEFKKLCDGQKIQFVGWIQSDQSYNYFEAADLIIFPGRHSVLY